MSHPVNRWSVLNHLRKCGLPISATELARQVALDGGPTLLNDETIFVRTDIALGWLRRHGLVEHVRETWHERRWWLTDHGWSKAGLCTHDGIPLLPVRVGSRSWRYVEVYA